MRTGAGARQGGAGALSERSGATPRDGRLRWSRAMSGGPAPSPDRDAIKHHLLVMVGAILAVDLIAIAIFYALHLNGNPGPRQQTFIGIWILISLAIVAIQQRKIRRAQRGNRPPGQPSS